MLEGGEVANATGNVLDSSEGGGELPKPGETERGATTMDAQLQVEPGVADARGPSSYGDLAQRAEAARAGRSCLSSSGRDAERVSE